MSARDVTVLIQTGKRPAADPGEESLLARDRRLADRCLAGGDEAFEELVRRHQAKVFRVAGRFFRQRDVVEEVAQEVFLKAFLALPAYRGEVPLEHWLCRITVNACYDLLRQRRRTAGTPGGPARGENPDPLQLLPDRPEDRPDEEFWRREQSRDLAERILTRLSPAERIVLTLLVLEELPVAEVARLTGWSRVNVKVRAFRARRKLQQVMQAEDLPYGG